MAISSSISLLLIVAVSLVISTSAANSSFYERVNGTWVGVCTQKIMSNANGTAPACSPVEVTFPYTITYTTNSSGSFSSYNGSAVNFTHKNMTIYYPAINGSAPLVGYKNVSKKSACVMSGDGQGEVLVTLDGNTYEEEGIINMKNGTVSTEMCPKTGRPLRCGPLTATYRCWAYLENSTMVNSTMMRRKLVMRKLMMI